MYARPLFTALTLAVSGCYDGGELETLGAMTTGGLESSGVATSTGPATSTGAEPTTTGLEVSSDPMLTSGSTSGVDETTGVVGPTSTTTDSDSGTTGDPLAECPRLRVMVAPDPTLNVRSTPSTEFEPVASLVHGAIVDTVAAVQGESIDGNTLWYQIAAPAGFVSGVFVVCTQELPPPPPEGYYLPLACGMSAKITQGNNGNTSHTGKTAYAFDFGLALDTPLHAMADGTVLHIYAETGPGDPCYGGGGPDCFPYGNLVVLLHGDGSTTLYKHLNEVDVALDEFVPRGGVVGLSGSTGYSTGPHAHVMRMENCGLNNCQSIPLEFIECGVPVQGQTVTSQNCL